jgi:hypothetical protein
MMYLLICILLEFEKKFLMYCKMNIPVTICICRKGGNPMKSGILFSLEKKNLSLISKVISLHMQDSLIVRDLILR